MKTKLIKNDLYLLLIDEEVICKTGELYLTSIKNDIKPKSKGVIQAGNKIIAYYPLKEAKELDLPLLPPFEKEIDIEELFYDNCKNFYDTIEEQNISKLSFYKGYKAAQSKTSFTLEDMKKAIEMSRKTFPTDKLSCDRYSTEEIIQSLSTQHLPKEFIPEYRYYYHSSKEFYSDAGFVECSKEQYESIKVEIPTCPLKAEIKTTINSEGKEEIQGTYKY